MKKIRTVPVSLFLFLFGILNTLHAAYYVATNGSDSYPGTFGSPFKTIQKAANTMMTNASSVTSYIKYGTYREKVTIRTNRNRKNIVFSKDTTSPIMNGSYASNFAFKITNAGNVTISGLTIARYSNGIILKGIATNNKILSSTIYSNRIYGIFINSESGDRNQIQGNDLWGQYHPQFMVHSYGICISNGDNNTISSNQYQGNKTAGIYLNGTAMGNNIINNLFFANNEYGIYITDADGNTIRTNQIFRNSTGIYFDGTAVGNYIIKNSIYSNNNSGIEFRASNNYILSNDIWGFNQDFGILFTSVANNNIRFNKIHHNQMYGIRITGSTYFNTIGQNSIYSNDLFGIRTIDLYSDNNYIVSNNFYGLNQNYGIYITAGADHKIYYNLFNRCQTNIYLTSATNTKIFNNTIFGAQDDGLLANNSIVTLYNNIFLSNGNGAGDYGVQRTGGGIVYLGYNDFYGISTRLTNGGCIWGTPNFTFNPLIDTSSSFAITTKNSPAIDTGKVIPGITDGYMGESPDLGWSESSFSLGPFYVDNSLGNDYYNGNISSPFRTIQRAANRIASAQNITSATCYVYPGNYAERVTIRSNKNSGYMVLTKISTPPVMNGSLSSNFAFKITNANNVIISGFTISKYITGLIITGNSANNRILSSTIYSNDYYGIDINSDNADNNYIQGNNVWGWNQNYGFNIADGDGNTFRSNQMHNNQFVGITLSGNANANNLIKNSIYSNGYGIYLNSDTANNNYILTNYLWGAFSYGIYLRNGNKNTIKSNQIHNNQNSGIYLYGRASTNYIIQNSIYSNIDKAGICINSETNDNNYILENNIWGANQDNGIFVSSGDRNTIALNQIHNNQFYGIDLEISACTNYIMKNSIYSNDVGINILTSANNNYILTNIIWDIYNNWGININTANDTKIYRNLFNNCNNTFIYLSSALNTKIYNNTIFKAGNHGVYANNSTVTLYNNIMLSNAQYGVAKSPGATVYLGYNDFYNNAGPTQGGCIWGSGNVTGNPMLDTTSSFAITSINSAAVDGGKEIQYVTEGLQGSAPDIGWLESSFSLSGPFYVDDDIGDDSNNGTFQAPFRTIQRAVNRMTPGVNVTAATCYIFPGTYAEKVTIASNKNLGYMVLTALSTTNPVMNGSGSPLTNYAFKLNNADQVIISGLTIAKYFYGIILTNMAMSNQIRTSTFYSNQTTGVYIYSDKNYILNNNFWANPNNGICISKGENNIIKSNHIHNQYKGISLETNAVNNYIIKNSFYSNSGDSIFFKDDSVDYNYILTNSISGGPSQYYGIHIMGGDNNTITFNHVHGVDHGIMLEDSASLNFVTENSVFSNKTKGICLFGDNADNNKILLNKTWGTNQDYGIAITDGDHNTIMLNQTYRQSSDGIYLEDSSSSNFIIKNSVFSNGLYGIRINSTTTPADNNYILSNNIWGTNTGIRINNADKNWIYRNLFNRNKTGIYLVSATNTKIFNNTIFGSKGTGVLANNSTATLLNNIILSNGNYGVQQTGVSTVYLGYNCIYGYLISPTNGGVLWDTSNRTNNPLIDTTSSFEILLRSSPCVDSGTVIPGITDNAINQPDMGWKEFFYDDTPPWSTANKESGFYSEPFDVIIEGKDNESPLNITIKYTLDNSDPTSSPTAKSGVSPVTININTTTLLKFYAVNSAGLPEASINTRQYDFIKIPSTDAAVYNNHLDLSQGEQARIIFGKPGNAEIKIYNVRGVLVKSFAKKFYARGESQFWNGTIENGPSKVGAGLYIVMITGDINMTLKMIVKK